ncbi:AN1-type zinc finger protein 4 [Cichlidogyrus casuarinus]|uniref:AN1-type zinc finger protein 4 n=1 Tax=Cichlidogyrus casuarinus TaxID=1844966 RepID=A0ABD2PV42_9PLAT
MVAEKPKPGTEEVPKSTGDSAKASSVPTRCAFCKKRTGLASSYHCRCGNNFCAQHRYAEAHACVYDYKTEARRVICEANPVVNAPKLPKI